VIIQMTVPMSGTRPGGDAWPAPFTDFEVAQWEGEHLIRGGTAVESELRVPPSQRPGFDPAAEQDKTPDSEQDKTPDSEQDKTPDSEQDKTPDNEQDNTSADNGVPAAQNDFAGGQETGQPAGQDEGQPDASAESAEPPVPSPSDLKSVWLDYALSRGADPATAQYWTKDRLMTEYGGRL
jgi:hypothetical protein